MTNPFENEGGNFFVLKNHENQFSLWPEKIAIPEGWNAVCGPIVKAECLAFIEREWVDMRPKTLVENF